MVFFFVPTTAFANMMFPGMLVALGIWSIWYVIVATLFIEAVVLQRLLSISFKKSFILSFIGNLVSSTVGTWILVWGSLLTMIPFAMMDPAYLTKLESLFDIVTYVFMCLGSIIIEVLTVWLFWRYPMKKLFKALMIGNVFTYALVYILFAVDILKLSDFM